MAFPIDAEQLKKAIDAQALAAAHVVWTCTAPEINSGHICGAQRLASGNTLICSGERRLVVEVDTQGKIAWDYLNAFSGDHSMMGDPGGAMRRGGRPGGRNDPGGARPDRQRSSDGASSTGGKPADNPAPAADKNGRPTDKHGDKPDGSDDGPRPPRGRPGGMRGPGGPGGRGGPGGMEPYGLFRAERYSPQDPGLVKLLALSSN